MIAIVCTDSLGGKHDVEVGSMKLYTAVYGIHHKEGTVLMVQDQRIGFWRFPGGKIEKTEREWQGLQRGIAEETGLVSNENVKMVHIMEEDFFDLAVNEGAHVTRVFYKVENLTGTIKASSLGISEIRYLTIDDVYKMNEKEVTSAVKTALYLADK